MRLRSCELRNLQYQIIGDEFIIEARINKVKLCLDSEQYKEKPSKSDMARISKRIAGQQVEVTIEDFASAMVAGQCFTPACFEGDNRTNEAWNNQQVFALDFDSGVSPQIILDRCKKYGVNPCFAYETFSSTKEKPKFRLVFCNETEVSNVRLRDVIQHALIRMNKECDKACKDLARYYCGGKAIIYEDYEARINAVKLLDSLCSFIIETDTNNHANRDIKDYCESVGLQMSGGAPKILIMYGEWGADEDEVEEQRAKFGCGKSSPIIYRVIGSPVVQPKNDLDTYTPLHDQTIDAREESLVCFIESQGNTYQLFFCPTQYDDKGKPRKKYKVTNEAAPERSYLENFSFEDLEKRCRLWKEFSEGTEDFTHDVRVGIATNLLWLKGGRKRFLEAINNAGHDEKTWASQCNYFVKRQYNAMQCESFCPYADTCEHAKNIVAQIALKKGMINVLSRTESKKTLEEASEELRRAFEYALASKENKVFVIKAMTGLGKTQLYENVTNTTIALPTHALKDEVLGRMKTKSIATPKIPVDDRLSYLYSVGSYATANRYINKLASEGNQEYIDFKKNMRIAENSTGNILTTHDKLLSLKNHNDTIIIDEDIIRTLLTLSQTSLQDIDILSEFDSATIQSITKYAKDAGDCLVYEMPSYAINSTKSLEEMIIKNKIRTNVLGFLNSSHFVKHTINDVSYVNFIVKRELPRNKKIIILSATVNKDICEMLFGDRLEFIDIGDVETKGSVVQFPQRSFSRYSIENESDLMILAKALVKEKPVITYKKYKDEFNCIANFGATEGIDAFKGMDIAIIGTPNVSPLVYLLYANALGFKPRINGTKSTMKYTKVIRNNCEFYFNTFSDDEALQEIQLYLIESELIQAVGRARILRNDCTVTVLSNFPIPGAEYKYLTKQQVQRLITFQKGVA